MRRRDFLKSMLSAAGSTMLCSCGAASSGAAVGRRGRVLILAFDGLDPRIVRQLMAQGRLPNFSRVASEGSFKTITSSAPPQTPVAFSNIISGADPGRHNIYDFIHRDPNPPGSPLAVMPYFSMSAAADPASAPLLDTIGWIEHLRGNDEVALEHLRRALTAGRPVPELHYHLGTVYLALKNETWAGYHLEEAAAADYPLAGRQVAEQVSQGPQG